MYSMDVTSVDWSVNLFISLLFISLSWVIFLCHATLRLRSISSTYCCDYGWTIFIALLNHCCGDYWHFWWLIDFRQLSHHLTWYFLYWYWRLWENLSPLFSSVHDWSSVWTFYSHLQVFVDVFFTFISILHLPFWSFSHLSFSTF